MSNTNFEFPVQLYNGPTPYNDVLSLARCRIFYKYGNRNGSYITPEFAEKLLKTLSYVPLKGIYEDGDFDDHGDDNAEGRIYGIIPENPNIAWEKHVDEDGVEREYACADVLLFTALYEEASEIIGKSLSMELFVPSIKYHHAVIKGERYIVFDEGSFIGLQVLGDDVEPCFEGAAIYSLQEKIKDAMFQLKQAAAECSINLGGQEPMEIMIKLSDREKYNELWDLLNPYDEETESHNVVNTIIDVFDEYAVVFNHETKGYAYIYYRKAVDEEGKEFVEIYNRVDVHNVFLTQEELDVVAKLRELNDNDEEVADYMLSAKENSEKIADLEVKNTELESEFSTLKMEQEEEIAHLNAELEERQASFSELSQIVESARIENAEQQKLIDELSEFKANVELKEKQDIISQFDGLLSSETLANYSAKINEYDAISLDKELTYELKRNGVGMFNQANDNLLYTGETTKSGIESILSKY